MIGYINFWSFYRLSYCIELWLQSNRLTHIQKWTFSGLSHLDQLVLSDNDIFKIEAGAFSHLSRCRYIWLNANELTNIKADMFKGLHSLKTISFHDNKLNNIAADVFQTLPSLQVISLNRNNISYVEPGTFANLTQLRILGLHTNRLTTVEENIFNELRPQNLTLIVDNNALWCDTRICWMRDAERDGWIKLNHFRGELVWGKPECVNYPGVIWDDLTLNCTDSGMFSSLFQTNFEMLSIARSRIFQTGTDHLPIPLRCVPFSSDINFGSIVLFTHTTCITKTYRRNKQKNCKKYTC